ncbi:MAG: GDP-L-fucose synthase [Synergistaceae bacterium]|jgi:GDP-L-fucose synthase|nr:GDP-L-fucose synthase [Synergistaceae bacterium]
MFILHSGCWGSGGVIININSKIFVAGHNGMVGSAILRGLIRDGYKNIITRSRSELDLLKQDEVNVFFGDERPDVVFLAAARVGGIMANMTNQAAFLYENLQIQNNVISAASRNGAKKFVFLGSSCIYPRDCPQPIKEEYFLTSPFEPTNEGYAIAKVAGMKLCGYLASEGVWDSVTVIPCNLYGPGDNFDESSSHVMAALVKRFADAVSSGKKTVVCWGTGNSRREFLHVDDLARAVLMLMNNNVFGSEPVNIGYGQDVTIKELAGIIAEKSGFSGDIVWDRSKPDGMVQKLMDTERARAIGFVPEISLEDGIESFIGEYRKVAALQGE